MKDDSIYIDHILQSINNIFAYTQNLSIDDFHNNLLVQDAVIRNFEIIGEATKKLSDDFKKINHELPWKEMAGMRNKLIHDYMGVDINIIWATLQKDLPYLKSLIEKI
jgi:uncharacterized protein with HEPN domain